MRSPQFHMPHLRQRSHAATSEAKHHHESPSRRFWQVERAMDYLVLAGIVIIGGVMAYGLMTASGDASWF